ncbi:MAG: alpha/beta fold hydrolase [Chloroflexi bacterium]|nr:MAG: alpha/beta fold hydrolase [Chloroflexota bacterium]MBL1195931.1 alpha/beta fold hydrolase [Chloroflexota bacterium]NOH13224.1 alpha/beta fold hydrolase [Chloroflexota bacterium]
MPSIPFRGETKTLNNETRQEAPGEFVQLSQGYVHYEQGGPEAGEKVVLVHGLSVPYYIWDPTFEALTGAGFRVLRYDLYGRGYSDRPQVQYDTRLFDGQLMELMNALEIDKAHLMGLSMGGVIAANFVNRHPERINKLVFIDPAGFDLGLSWQFNLILLPGFGELIFNLAGDETLLNSMADDFYLKYYVDEFIECYKPQMKFKGFKRALLSTWRNGMLKDDIGLYEPIGKTEREVLLVWGKEDQTVPFKHSSRLVAAIPQIQFHAIDEAGHIPHYELPEVVNPILINYLRGN